MLLGYFKNVVLALKLKGPPIIPFLGNIYLIGNKDGKFLFIYFKSIVRYLLLKKEFIYFYFLNYQSSIHLCDYYMKNVVTNFSLISLFPFTL